MFCPNCGSEVKDGAVFCPSCGSLIGSSSVNGQPETSDALREEASATKKHPKKEKKKGKGKFIALAIVAVIVIVVIAVFMSGGSDGEDETAAKAAEFSEEVQNGYLGNYDTVTVKDVVEYLYAGGEWTYGTSQDGTYYIVDYCNEDYVELQFTVYDDGSETFTASGIDSFSDDTDTYSSSALAAFFNGIYGSYISAHPECGLTAVSDDEKADETVLEGHFGPVKSVEESEYANMDDNSETEEDEENITEDVQEEEPQSETAGSDETAEGEDSFDYSSLNIYGEYFYDDGEEFYLYAYIDFIEGDATGDYITLDSMSYGGHGNALTGGYMTNLGDGVYYVSGEYEDLKFKVIFDEDGNIDIVIMEDYTDETYDYDIFEGHYTKTEDYDYSE